MGFRDQNNKVAPIDDGGNFDTDTNVSSVTSTSESAANALAAANSSVAAIAAKVAAELAETNAETAETNASTSATNAATSETNASTSETNAAASASAAASSAADAQSSEDDAEVSETNAANSAAAALVSENNASTSETNAASSAAAALVSENAAAASETASSASASAASTSETNAAASETNAAASETAAAASETAAQTAQAAAEAAEASTESLFDQFGDQYLGPKASDPTVDNDGNSLAEGAVYFNTTDDVLKFYSGSAWVAPESVATTAAAAAQAAQAAAETAETNAETAETNAAASASSAASSASAASTSASEAAASAASINLSSIDIDGGTIDGAVIGGVTPAAITGTAITGTSFATSGDMTFGDNDKAIFGGVTSELQIYSDGSNSIIREGGTGALRFQANGPYAEIMNGGATETMARFNNNGSVDLYYDNSPKLATTSTGIAVTGDATFADNNKAIFGAGSDLQIYHDGSKSVIQDAGTGNLELQSSTQITLWNAARDKVLAVFRDGDYCKLYHNGSEKLATTSTGIDVTGTVTADGLTVDGNSELNGLFEINNTSVRVDLMETDAVDLNGRIQNTGGTLRLNTLVDDKTSQKIRLSVDHSTGDISFYEDTGTTAKFFWDASAESLTLNSTLKVEGGTTNGFVQASGSLFQLGASTASDLVVYTNNAEAMRINSSGNVGIGTDSPSAGAVGGTVVHVQKSGGTASVRVDRSDASTAGTLSMTSGNTTNGFYGTGAKPMVFSTNATERMRINPSGNVLVGKTSDNQALAGVKLGTGGSNMSRDNEVLVLNRLSTDGTILNLKKDGTTVGSIGARGGDVYLETGNTGIRMYDASEAIIPVGNTGVSRDGAIDLGLGPNLRFKDLHLSGTVNANSVDLGSFVVTETNGHLYFSVNGVNKMKLDSSGNLDVVGSVNSNATIT